MRNAPSAVRSRRGYRPAVLPLEGRRLLSTLMVDDDHKQCPDALYSSIQDAVNAALPGDIVEVCPGTYREQVTIPATKTSLELISERPGKATIQAPAAMTPNPSGIKSIVEVDAKNVLVQGFTIAGPSQGIDVGVLIDQKGSATLAQNHITDIQDAPALTGATQRGIGVYVRHGTASILGNTIDDYQKAGIFVAFADSSAEIAYNTLRGVGPTDVIAQNGIQVSDGATANIHDNTISDNVFTGGTNAATGILVINPGPGLQVRNNTVTKNDLGIYFSGVTNGIMTGNSVSKSTYDGITLADGTTGTLVANNQSRKNGGDGIFVDSTSTNNTIRDNTLKQNKNFDAEDQSHGAGTSGTGNFWQNNQGKTSSPPGLVQNSGGHDSNNDDNDHGDDHGDDGPPKAHGHGHDEASRDDELH